MTTNLRTLTVFLAAATALSFCVLLGAPAPKGWGRGAAEFEEAQIFLELNHTDGDLGIQGLIDGGPWKDLVVKDPKRRTLLKVKVNGRLSRQGLAEIFFESDEPSFDELLPEQFFQRFPEGEYRIEGKSLEGSRLKSTAEVTHLLPAPPRNVQVSGVPAAEDCDADPLPSISGPVIISWDPVTHSHPDLGRTNEEIEVLNYQVVVEQEDVDLNLTVNLPPTVTSFEVPSGFIALSGEWKFEIVVREAGGNRTAVESCFVVE